MINLLKIINKIIKNMYYCIFEKSEYIVILNSKKNSKPKIYKNVIEKLKIKLYKICLSFLNSF